MKMHTETDHLKTTCSCKCSTLSIKFTSEQLKSTCKHTLDSKMVTSIPNAISCRAAVRPAIPAPIIITLPCFLAAKKKKHSIFTKQFKLNIKFSFFVKKISKKKIINNAADKDLLNFYFKIMRRSYYEKSYSPFQYAAAVAKWGVKNCLIKNY